MIKTNNSSLRHLSTIAAFTVLTASAAAPALAGPSSEALSVHVKYGDLDLTSASGVTELYNRIRAASDTVCEPFSGRELTEVARYKACVSTAMSRAVMDAKEPALTALYAEKSGKLHSQQRLAQLDLR